MITKIRWGLSLSLFTLTTFADINVAAVNALVTQNTSAVGPAPVVIPALSTPVSLPPVAAGLDPRIEALTRNYTIVVFYESTCPHCQRYTPILKAFADDYGFTVYPFSVDGPTLPAFPKSLPVNPGILHTFFPTGQVVLPTAFLVNKQNLMTYPINVGEMAMPDLISRMDDIAADIQKASTGETP